MNEWTVSQIIALLDIEIAGNKEFPDLKKSPEFTAGYIKGLEQARYLFSGKSAPYEDMLCMTREEAMKWALEKAQRDDKLIYLFKAVEGGYIASEEWGNGWVFKAYPGGRMERRG